MCALCPGARPPASAMMPHIDPSWGLWGLFVGAFISSTLLPGGSELILLLLAAQHDYDRWVLLLVATAGNTLGGMTSWGLGVWLASRFPARFMENAAYQTALARIQRWGGALLLFSWVPVAGDPLCVAAGWWRIPWMIALFYIAVGKAARYAILLALV